MKFDPYSYKKELEVVTRKRVSKDDFEKRSKLKNKPKQNIYELKILNYKFKKSIELITDRFMATEKLLFIRVDFHIPTVDEVNEKLLKYGAQLTPLQMFRLKNITTDNKIMKTFKRNLQRILDIEDARKYFHTKDKAHFNELGLIWVREYGKKKKRRHYHCLLMVNANRIKTVGDYKLFPSDYKCLADKIAFTFLNALGLADIEETYSNKYLSRHEGVMLGGYVNFKPLDKSLRSHRVINRDTTEDDMDWLYRKLNYMFKKETKGIPEEEKGIVNEREAIFGKSWNKYLGKEEEGKLSVKKE